jgi:hypothetical protein
MFSNPFPHGIDNKTTDIRGIHFNSPYNRSGLPIPEHDEAATPRTEQASTMYAVNGPTSGTALVDEPWALLEVAVDFYTGLALLDSVGVGVVSPSKRSTSSERLVSPREGGVNDVFAIAADGDEPG